MTIEKIAGTENQRADFLAKIGSSLIDCRERKITVMGLGIGDSVFAISDVLEDWRSPIIHLLEGMKPNLKKKKKKKGPRKEGEILLVDKRSVFRKTFLPTDAKCLSRPEGILVIVVHYFTKWVESEPLS